mgnify:CR=1 FL=1
MYYYFLLICALYFGFFDMPDAMPGLLRDIMILPLFVYSLVVWKKPKRGIFLEMLLMFLFGTFVFYNVILLVSTEKYLSEITSLLNIRIIYPFLLFFITISVVNTKERLMLAIKFGLIMSVIASLTAIAQSIYGSTPMFDPAGFYNIGHWEGQGGMMIGPIARVTLPTLYFVYLVFIAMILYFMVSGKIKHPALLILLTIVILISFTRSAWLATLIAIIAAIVILNRYMLINKNTFSISFILLTLLSGGVVLFIMLDNPISVSLNDRLLSIFSDLQNASGTFGYRLLNLQRFVELWKSFGFFFGVDPFFIGRFNEPTLADVGYVYVLVTIGLIGFILLILMWLLGIIYGYRLVKAGSVTMNYELILSGSILSASIIFFIICQAYTQYGFVTSIFSVVYGLAIASRRIYND